MNASVDPAVTHLYALRLHRSPAGEPRRLAGRLEHVLSGRCREFGDSDSLLACLADDSLVAAPANPSPLAPTVEGSESPVPAPEPIRSNPQPKEF